MRGERKLFLILCVFIAALCVVAYARSLSLPLISDDYLQIRLAREYGPVAQWGRLAADPLYRCRATSLLLTYWTEQWFGFSEMAFNLSSLLLHIAASWMVLALGYWSAIGWRTSAVAACFFAVYYGHQEAVIWYAAIPELLVFLFATGSFLLWLAWMKGGSRVAYAGSLLCYVLALLSKESAVCVVGLVAISLLAARAGLRRRLLHAAPYAVLAAVYFALAYTQRAAHLHFNDGTFSLQAPVLVVLLNSIGRLLWIWGFLALGALALWRPVQSWRIAALALAWMTATLLPYSFLTYQPHVPSRHSYFASAGLAFLVAAGLLAFRERFPRRSAVAAVAIVMAAHDCAYLWTRKHEQFVERAAPTERLIDFARHRSGPIYAECFPYTEEIAESAIVVMGCRRALPVHVNRGVRSQTSRTLNLCSVSGSRQ
jgi:hypothetical protein